MMPSGWSVPPSVGAAEGDDEEADEVDQEFVPLIAVAQLVIREFNFAVIPQRPHPVLKLGDKVISTPGIRSHTHGDIPPTYG
jgi:hypothetical protein